jgi:hypothetical protein
MHPFTHTQCTLAAEAIIPLLSFSLSLSLSLSRWLIEVTAEDKRKMQQIQ